MAEKRVELLDLVYKRVLKKLIIGIMALPLYLAFILGGILGFIFNLSQLTTSPLIYSYFCITFFIFSFIVLLNTVVILRHFDPKFKDLMINYTSDFYYNFLPIPNSWYFELRIIRMFAYSGGIFFKCIGRKGVFFFQKFMVQSKDFNAHVRKIDIFLSLSLVVSCIVMFGGAILIKLILLL